MKGGYFRFYRIYLEPFLVSQSFFVFSFHTRKLFTIFFFIYLKKEKETLGLLNKKLDEIKEQRNHRSL